MSSSFINTKLAGPKYFNEHQLIEYLQKKENEEPPLVLVAKNNPEALLSIVENKLFDLNTVKVAFIQALQHTSSDGMTPIHILATKNPGVLLKLFNSTIFAATPAKKVLAKIIAQPNQDGATPIHLLAESNANILIDLLKSNLFQAASMKQAFDKARKMTDKNGYVPLNLIKSNKLHSLSSLLNKKIYSFEVKTKDFSQYDIIQNSKINGGRSKPSGYKRKDNKKSKQSPWVFKNATVDSATTAVKAIMTLKEACAGELYRYVIPEYVAKTRIVEQANKSIAMVASKLFPKFSTMEGMREVVPIEQRKRIEMEIIRVRVAMKLFNETDPNSGNRGYEQIGNTFTYKKIDHGYSLSFADNNNFHALSLRAEYYNRYGDKVLASDLGCTPINLSTYQEDTWKALTEMVLSSDVESLKKIISPYEKKLATYKDRSTYQLTGESKSISENVVERFESLYNLLALKNFIENEKINHPELSALFKYINELNYDIDAKLINNIINKCSSVLAQETTLGNQSWKNINLIGSAKNFHADSLIKFNLEDEKVFDIEITRDQKPIIERLPYNILENGAEVIARVDDSQDVEMANKTEGKEPVSLSASRGSIISLKANAKDSDESLSSTAVNSDEFEKPKPRASLDAQINSDRQKNSNSFRR
jgi:hypothetical protein